jgi:molybdate transport system substrate-binding protein
MRVRALIVALLMFGMMGPTAAATINLYAAGSLQNALTDVAKTYQSATGNTVSAKYGPSGLLKSEIS